MRVCSSLACLLLAACGSSSTTSTPDAAPMADAAAASVRTVTCPPGSMPTVTTTTNTDTAVYTPASTTISVGGIVKFVMPSAHNVAPNPIKPTDPGLHVDFGATACLEFDKAGSFGFYCTVHSFAGTIIVQ